MPKLTSAEKWKVLESMPDTATLGEIRTEIRCRESDAPISALRYGDRALTCDGNATGRYIGLYDGEYLVGWVSAMDNSLNVGVAVAGNPSTTCPVPSEDALAGIAVGLRVYLRTKSF